MEGFTDCKNLVGHSWKEINAYVECDEVLSGTYDRLKNAPSEYEVRKESGLAEIEVHFDVT